MQIDRINKNNSTFMGMPNKSKRKFTDFDFTHEVSDTKWEELHQNGDK